MRTSSTVFIVTLVLLLTGAGVAWATDYCFEDNFGTQLVAKAFIVPTAGNCKPVNGYFIDQNYAASGNACRTSDGTKVIFNLLSTDSSSLPLVYTFQVPPPNLTGGTGTNCQLKSIGVVCAGMSIGKIICPSPKPFGS